MPRRLPSVNPAKFKDETFELWSVPSFDVGQPEILLGAEIGSSKKVVQEGDVLLSRIVPHIRRAWEVKPTTVNRQIGSGEWITFRSEKFHAPYLRHFLLTDRFNAQLMQTVAGVGGSLLRARPESVRQIEMLLPPITEQKRLAEVLDQADALRRQRQRALDHLNKLGQSIFYEMFGDPLFPKSEFQQEKIASLCTIVRGSSPRPKGDPRYYNGPIPRLMIADITRDGWRVTPQIDSLTVEGSKKSRPVVAGTVVMAVSGNIGLVSRLAVDACIHDGFVAFKDLDTSRIKPNFLLFVMSALKASHGTRQAGAIFKNITTKDIKGMDIPVPNIRSQEKFLERYDKLKQQEVLFQDALDKTQTLFASLQQCAFRGEL